MNRAMWRTIQNSSWLLGGLCLLGLAFFLWIGIQIHHRIVVEKTTPQVEVPVEPEKVKFSPTLGMMTDMVPELNLNEGVNTSTHAAEFRGASFLKEQNNRWTIQLMNVTQEEVIIRYLEQRPDRSQFYYFRTVQPNQPEHYLLVFGSFKSVSEALNTLKKTSFALPDSIKVMPQQFSAYKKMVTDDVGSEDSITNLAGSNKLYQVRLRAIALPDPSEPAVNQGNSAANTVSNPEKRATTGTMVVPRLPTDSPIASNPTATVPNVLPPVNTPVPATPATAPVTENPAPIADPFN